MIKLLAVEQEILNGMVERHPHLESCVEGLVAFHRALVKCYDEGHKLMVCGNGGSCADAMHIVGELSKCYLRKRPVRAEIVIRLQDIPMGKELARHLETGLPALTLGLNGALRSAIENDSPIPNTAYAQELFSIGKPGDVLLAISTSGNAANCLMASAIAKAVDIRTVCLTGADGGKLAPMVDIAIKAPATATPLIQEAHEILYHTFCAMIEAHYFPERR